MKRRLVIPTVLSVIAIGVPLLELGACESDRTDPPTDTQLPPDIGSLPSMLDAGLDAGLDAVADSPPDAEIEDAALPVDSAPPDTPA